MGRGSGRVSPGFVSQSGLTQTSVVERINKCIHGN